MKYLKKINELYKSTYMSAADKLDYSGKGHSYRADKIREYGKEKGLPQSVDRISAHRFSIRFNRTDYMDQHDNEYYSLVKVFNQNSDPFSKKMYKYLGFDFISNYNKKIRLYLGFIPNEKFAKLLEDDNRTSNPKGTDGEYDGVIIWEVDNGKSQYYRFKDRKDAVQIKKAAVEFIQETDANSSNSDLSDILRSLGYQPYYGTEDCEFCQGTGQVNCPECEEHGPKSDCDMCSGEGFATCPECDGEGFFEFDDGDTITGYYDEEDNLCELDTAEMNEITRDYIQNIKKEELERIKKLNINSLYTSDRNEVRNREEDKAKAAKVRAEANPPLVGFGSFMSKKKK